MSPALEHREVSAELQQIRGPYTLSTGIAAFTRHNEFHKTEERAVKLPIRNLPMRVAMARFQTFEPRDRTAARKIGGTINQQLRPGSPA
jgi:hypothetical protein